MISNRNGYNNKSANKNGARTWVTFLLVLMLVPAALLLVRRAAVRPPEPPPAVCAQGVRARSLNARSALCEEQTEVLAAERARRPYCYTILLFGVDDAGGGSDTMLLARFDVPQRRIDLVSLPRDTLLHGEKRSNRLNYAYASGGVDTLRAEVTRLLGVPVDFYVRVDLRGFAALVDAVGGISFDVPCDMDYDDDAQGLHIHFSKGVHRLCGREAMEVVRWRKNNDGTGYADADVGRIATQQAFLRSAAEQLCRLSDLPALVRTFFACVKTDLNAGNLMWLAGKAWEIGTQGLHFHTLPGDGARSYRRESVYVLDPEATLALVNEALDPYTDPIRAEELDILVPD